MKKIVIVAAVLISLSVKGQTPCGSGIFPTIDSLQRFVNIHIRNSAINSFTNLRLNSAMIGVAQWLDCIRDNGMDSLHIIDAAGSDPDTIKVYRAGAFAFYKLLPPGGGTGSDNATSGQGGFRLLNLGTQTLRELTPGVAASIDTTLAGRIRIGVDTASLPKDTIVEEIGQKISQSGGQITFSTKSPVFKNLAEMRGVGAAFLDTGTIYFRNTSGMFVPYKWNSTSTSNDDSVTVIQRTGTATGRFELYFEDKIMVEWFGAIANDGLDDSYYFQKAVNFCVASPKKPKLMIGSGTFRVNNVVIYKDANSDGTYEFNTFTMEGAVIPFNYNQSGTGAQTVFECTDADGFSIAIQLGRQVVIKNISFTGMSPSPGSTKNTFEWADASWISGVRNNRYSPHAAIVTDPFNSNVTAGNRYPNMTAWYTTASGSGTSLVQIDGCAFRNFVVGVMVSPNGTSQNGDNIRVTNFASENCRSFWASGQTQSRVNSIENGYILGGTKYVVNCAEYGESRGSAPSMTNVNMAGGIKYLYHLSGGFNGMSLTNCRAEMLHALGFSSIMPVDIVNCEIALAVPQENNVFAAPVLAEGYVVNFSGGTLEYFDATYAAALPFNVRYLSFNGTYLRGFPLNAELYMQQTIVNGQVEDQTAGEEYVYEANAINKLDVSQLNTRILTPGSLYVNSLGQYYKSIGQKIDWLYVEDKQLNIDSTNYTAYFIASDPGAYAVNDCISTQITVDNASDIFGASSSTLGWVYDKSGDTIKLKYPPYGLNESTTYSIFLSRWPKLISRTRGNTTNGSNLITGVEKYQVTFPVGALVKGNGIPAGARVTAISNDTITISRNATATATAVELYDAKYRLEAYAADPSDINYLNPGWFKGDIIYNNTYSSSNDTIYAWVATDGGFTGGTNPPTFEPIKFTGTGGGGSGITSLNTLTGGTQTFATGTTGTDFGISSSGSTHTFNLPNASATARGVVSTGSQTFAGNKTFEGDVIAGSTKTKIGEVAQGDAETVFGVSGGFPLFSLNRTANAVGEKRWDMFINGTQMIWRVLADDLGSNQQWFRATRSGVSVTKVEFPLAKLLVGTAGVDNGQMLQVGGTSELGGLATYAANYSPTADRDIPDVGYVKDGTFTMTNKTLTSPSLTGTPTAPTATSGTNTTQIATTAFVQTALTNITSNTFTSTITNGTNVTSSTFRGARYIRVGDQVNVSITVDIEATAAGATTIEFSLPVASAFTTRYLLDGSGSNGSISATVFGEATNDRAIANFSASGSGTTVWTFHFQYTVIAP